ncbi:MAG: hypothetical protein AB1564_02245 [Chloroflexota bacterium]
MKLLKLMLVSAFILASTVGASQGLPVSAPAAVAPTKPVPLTPANNALITNYTPDLTWKASTGVDMDHYEIEIATDPAFGATIIDSDYGIPDGTLTHTVGLALTPARTYYWHVRSVSTLAESLGWSATYKFRTAVEPPNLVSPADMTNILTNRPTFDWDGVLNASGYTLQVSKYYGFTSLLINVNLSYTVTEYTPTSDLPANQTLYWRVRTTNSGYGPSDWSPIFTITQTAIPTSIPVLSQPADDKLTDDPTPLLVWGAVTVPSGTTFQEYQIQIAKDDTFAVVDIDDVVLDVATPWYQVPDGSILDAAATYYWRVRAYNVDDLTADLYSSSWSEVFSLRISVETPTLIDPINMLDLIDNKPTFDWTDVPHAGNYTFQASYTESFARPFLTALTTLSEYTPGRPLPSNRTIYWRVRANNSKYGPGRWSVTWSVNSANPPGVPRLLSPTINRLLTTLAPELKWSVSSLPAGTSFDYYQVQVATDTTFAAPVFDDTSNTGQFLTSIIVSPDLNPATKYYWRVRACNTDLECSQWSAVYYFRISVEAPTLNTPTDGEVNAVPFAPAFDWTDVPSASGYTLQVSKKPNFSVLTLSRTVTLSEYTSGNLPAGTYYWRVRANSPYFGPGPWSTVFTFTVTP